MASDRTPLHQSEWLTLPEWMERTGTTQVQLSEATGIPQPLLSKYVRGAQRAQLDNALAIERATGGLVPVEVWETGRWKKGKAA